MFIPFNLAVNPVLEMVMSAPRGEKRALGTATDGENALLIYLTQHKRKQCLRKGWDRSETEEAVLAVISK